MSRPHFSVVLAIVLAFFTHTALANGLTIETKVPSTTCLLGCYDSLSFVTFKDIKTKKPDIAEYCNSTSFTTSVAICVDRYCNSKQKEEGWEYFQEECGAKKIKIKLPVLADVVSKVDMSGVPEVDTLSHQKEKYNGTILLSQHSWEMGYKTNNVAEDVHLHHHAYGYTMYLLLATAVIIGMLNRLFSLYVQRYLMITPEDGMAPSAKNDHSIWARGHTLYRKHFATPALFGYRHAQPWGWLSIPTRVQAFFVFAYILISVVFMCTGYTIFRENTNWYDNEAQQLQRYVADRLAIMCAYNLPLLFALAGRNDVILWLTGWSYSTANIFHRWVARMATLQGFVHGILWVVMKKDSLRDRFLHRMYWATGVFALICMSFMVVLSIRPIREKSYEVFLIVHIVLAVASLVLLMKHITHMKGAYDPFIWACIAVWVLDRVIRLLRVVVITFTALSKKGKNTVAVMSDTDSGLLRLTITTSIRIRPNPGDYYFLYTPLSIKPWENHPFTVASWEIGQHSTTLHFLVAPQTGTTKRWRKKISKKQDRTDNVRMLLEGPYGHTNPVEQFERVLLVAGGSGITSMLPYIHRLCHPEDRFKNFRTRYIDLVWIAKNTNYAADVLNHELKEYIRDGAAATDIEFNVRMYLTKEENANPRTLVDNLSLNGSSSGASESGSSSEGEKIVENTPQTPSTAMMDGAFTEVELSREPKPARSEDPSDEKNLKTPTSASRLNIFSGRPSMQQILSGGVSCLIGGERLAVSACGPAEMTDDMRRAVCDVYGSGEEQVAGGAVEYFEELFSW